MFSDQPYLGISREWIPPLDSTMYFPEDTFRITSSLYLKHMNICVYTTTNICYHITFISKRQEEEMIYYKVLNSQL